MLSFQLIGPLTRYFAKPAQTGAQQYVQRYVEPLARVQGILPPGLAADAISQAVFSRFMAAFSSFAVLCAFVLLIGYCLHVRLLAQYRGENLSEVAAASASPRDRSLRLGWNLPGFSAPVAAVFEKEIRYLLRSGPMLLTLIMPLFVLVVFRFGPAELQARPRRRRSSARTPDMAFPAAAAYTLLLLTNLAYNNFGGDAGGIQFFYASPVSFREIVLAKNLTHAGILAIEVLVAWIAVGFLYGRPTLDCHGRIARRPVICCAGELRRRQPAVDLRSEETGLFLLRPSARFSDHSVDQPGSPTFRRRRGSVSVLDRAHVRQPLDRNPNPASAGGNFALGLPDDS